jgi:chromosome segregation ATPase
MSEVNKPVNKSQPLPELEQSISQERDASEVNQSHLSLDSPNLLSQSTTTSTEILSDIDWYAIAKKIRTSNRQLVKKIVDLEKLIQEKESKLETQQKQYINAENIIEQQTQELNQTQTEMSHLYHELENLNKQQENQQKVIEGLSQELKANQEHIARLERECSLLQENYNQQERQLLQGEKQNRELQIRLQRQQQYTLQFKNALDQCLGNSSEEIEDKLQEWELNLTPKVSEIKPWSKAESVKNDFISSNLNNKLLNTNSLDNQKLEDMNKKLDSDNYTDSQTEVNDNTEKQKLNDLESQENKNISDREEHKLESLNDQKINSDNLAKKTPSAYSFINSFELKSKAKGKPKKAFIKLPNLPKFRN